MDRATTFDPFIGAVKPKLKAPMHSPDYRLLKLCKNAVRSAKYYEALCRGCQGELGDEATAEELSAEERRDRLADAAGERLYFYKTEIEETTITTLAGAHAVAVAMRYYLTTYGLHCMDFTELVLFLASPECARQIATASAKGT